MKQVSRRHLPAQVSGRQPGWRRLARGSWRWQLYAQHCLSHDARSQLRPVARRSARSCQLFRPRFRSVGPALAAMRLLLLASGVPKLCLRFAARAMSLTTVHCVCRLTSRRMIAGTGLFMDARSQCREHDCRRRASCRAPSAAGGFSGRPRRRGGGVVRTRQRAFMNTALGPVE